MDSWLPQDSPGRSGIVAAVLIPLLAAGLGCSNGPEQVRVETSDLQRSCETNADCVAADSLACATYCDAEAVAIHESAKRELERRRERKSDACKSALFGPIDCLGESDDSWPRNNLALCRNGTCELKTRQTVVPEPNRSCETTSDCEWVNNGDVCASCRCNIAVNRSAAKRIRAARAERRREAECGTPEHPLDCAGGCKAARAPVVCLSGRCVPDHNASSDADPGPGADTRTDAATIGDTE